MKPNLSLSSILSQVNAAHHSDKTVVLVTGVFDVLHQEHLNFLRKARAAGDLLVVGLESDARVTQIKGLGRPINSATSRVQNLLSSGIPDLVFILPDHFSSPADHQLLISTIKPSILAVSSHTAHLAAKQKILKQFGGTVQVVHQYNPQVSSTTLLEPSSSVTTYHSQVISGKGRGKTIGFPTLNLTIPPELSIQHGIYAGWVMVKGHRYPGAFHFGPIPTFADSRISLEVFVLDHTFAPVPKQVSFQLISFLRPIKSFSSPASLSSQISSDVTNTKQKLNLVN